jgi:alpha-beta hydrolase superfamily lysophospholipase
LKTEGRTMTAAPFEFAIDAVDGRRIHGLRWHGSAAPRAVLQIAHGMGEHAGRYGRLAQALVVADVAVYANHHRGHGPHAHAAGELGDFGSGGFAAVVGDMARLSEHVRAQHPGVPLVVLGHSMGSFAAQLYMLDQHRSISALALSGTADTRLRFANRDVNRKLQDLNAHIEQPRTPFDWLSRDAREVDAYIADPLCGFTITPASRQSMFEACDRLAAADAFAAVRKDLPVYLFSGDHDPVNAQLAHFHPLVQRLREAGLTDVQARVYAGARHEVLNETNRADVTADLRSWLRGVTGRVH